MKISTKKVVKSLKQINTALTNFRGITNFSYYKLYSKMTNTRLNMRNKWKGQREKDIRDKQYFAACKCVRAQLDSIGSDDFTSDHLGSPHNLRKLKNYRLEKLLPPASWRRRWEWLWPWTRSFGRHRRRRRWRREKWLTARTRYESPTPSPRGHRWERIRGTLPRLVVGPMRMRDGKIDK